MPLFRRPDGDPVRDLSPLRRMVPYLFRTRNESVVYHEALYEVAAARAWLEAFSAARPAGAAKATLFHLFLHACARGLHERPGLNRFVSGRTLYQRRDVAISFAAKRDFSDDAPIVTRKVVFPRDAPFAANVDRIVGRIGEVRSGRPDRAEKEVSLALRLPGFILGASLGFLRFLDRWNLMPAAMIDSDPLYASLFAANLGSLGLDRVSHHLYEWGTVSLFGAMGTVGPRIVAGPGGVPESRELVEIRWTFDERINDGFYCARSLRWVQETFESPARVLGDPVSAAKST